MMRHPAAADALVARALPASRSKTRLLLLTFSHEMVEAAFLSDIIDHVSVQSGNRPSPGFPAAAAAEALAGLAAADDRDGGAAVAPLSAVAAAVRDAVPNHVIGIVGVSAPLPTSVHKKHVHVAVWWDTPHNLPQHLMWSFYLVKQSFALDYELVPYKQRSRISSMLLDEPAIHITADVSTREWSPANATGLYAYVAHEQAAVLKKDPRPFVSEAASRVVVIERWNRTLEEIFAKRMKSGKVDSFEVCAKAVEVARAEGVSKAMAYLADNHPEQFMVNGAKIEAQLATVAAPPRAIKRRIDDRVPWNDSDTYRSFHLWLDDNYIKGEDRRVLDHIMVPDDDGTSVPKALVRPRLQTFQIVGPSNSGKTSMVLDHFPRDRIIIVSGTWSIAPFRAAGEKMSNGDILAVFLDDVKVDQYFAHGFKSLLSGQGGSLNAKMAAPFTFTTSPPVIIATNEDIRKAPELSSAMKDWLMDDQNLFTAVVRSPLMPDGRYYKTSVVNGKTVVQTANRDKVLGPLNSYFKNRNDRDLIDDAGVGLAPVGPAAAGGGLPPPPPIDTGRGGAGGSAAAGPPSPVSFSALSMPKRESFTVGAKIAKALSDFQFSPDAVVSLECTQCHEMCNTYMGLCITCWTGTIIGAPWKTYDDWTTIIRDGRDPVDAGFLCALYPCCDQKVCWWEPTYCRRCCVHM